MNEIKVKRLFFAGLATFLVWILFEILLEHILGRLLFGNLIQQQMKEAIDLRDWTVSDEILNIFIAILNSTVLIWLYASLRPMYGVGAKTALITSAFGIVWVWSMGINLINLGLIPAQVGLIELGFETIEFPVAILAGAEVYEGRGDRAG